MNTPLLYVAGPYSANRIYTEQDHIYQAEHVSISLVRAGFHVITPHKNTDGYEKYEDDKITFDTWIEMDINILKRCDGIYLFGDFEKSRGAMIEFNYAIENNIPTFISTFWPANEFSLEDFCKFVCARERLRLSRVLSERENKQ